MDGIQVSRTKEVPSTDGNINFIIENLISLINDDEKYKIPEYHSL